MEALLFIFLIVYSVYLGSKISGLQEEINELKKGYTSQRISNAPTPPQPPQGMRQTQTSFADKLAVDDGPSLTKLFQWYQDDWPLKTGGLLILLGFSWLVSYAFIQNWIGPYARVVLGFIAGAVTMVFGTVWMKRHQLQGNVLIVIGIGIELITIWAAAIKYEYFPIEFGYTIVLVLVAYIAWIAVRYNSEDIAIQGNLIGGLAPFLIRTPDLPFTTHITYLMILTVGLVWLVSYRGWRKLLLSSTIVVFLTSLAHIPSLNFTDDKIQLNEFLFASSAFLLFYSSALVVTLVHKTLSRADIGTLVLNTAFITLWIFLTIPDQLQGVISLLITIIYLLGTAGVYYYTQNRHHIFIHVSISMLMLAITALFELEGPVLTIALIFFTTLYSGLTSYLLGRARHVIMSSFLLLIPLLMEVENLIQPWTDKEFFNYTLLSLAFSISFAYTTHIMYGLYKKNKDELSFAIVATYAYSSSFFILLLIWRYAHLIIENVNVARTVALIIYSIIGALAYVYGRNKPAKYVRYFGSALIAVVVLRLLFVETASMSIAGKIVTFIVAGLVLISTIFFQKQSQNN